MNRTCYVKNSAPRFVVPEHHAARPKFLCKAFNYARTRRVWMWEGFAYLRPHTKRSRAFNRHRAQAIQAGVECMLHHVHITSGMVQASCEQMADLCGLSTVSAAGNKSITRLTRMIDDLEAFSLIETERVWDKTLGMWIPKLIWVTKLFWRMVGLPFEEYQTAQNQQLGYMKRGLLLSEQEQLTLTEARRRAKQQFIERAFEARRRRHQTKRAERRAKALDGLGLDEQRGTLANDLMRRLRPEERAELGLEGFRQLVDRELGRIRSLNNRPPT